MNQFKIVLTGAFVSLFLTLALGHTTTAYAKHHEGHGEGKGGPCAEIKCEKGDKFCKDKKHECMAKMFEKKMAEAKSKGITAEKKAEWIKHMEEKIAHKKERIKSMQDKVAQMEKGLVEVKALKTK
jgi:hypothetical protein